jgi:hypothetical protein
MTHRVVFFSLVLLLIFSSKNSYADVQGDLTSCLKEGPSPDSEIFPELSTSIGDATLVTVDVFTGYSSFSESKGDFGSGPKALGIQVSSSLPATSPTLEDYANATLLLRKGGILNAYFSLSSSPKWFDSQVCPQKQVDFNEASNKKYKNWVRNYMPDRLYFSLYPVPPLLKAYFIHGVGIKAFKTGLVDDPNIGDSGSDIDVGGTVYIGFGVDGPVWLSNDTKNDLGPAGTLDMQVNLSYTRVNSGTLRKMYSVDNLDESNVYAAGAKLSLIVTRRVSLELDYVAPIGSSKEFMSETVYFNVAYALSE